MALLLAAALFDRLRVLAGWPRLPHGTLGCAPRRMVRLLRFSVEGVRRFLCPSPASSLLWCGVVWYYTRHRRSTCTCEPDPSLIPFHMEVAAFLASFLTSVL